MSVTLDDVNHAAMEKGMTEAELRATGPTVTASHQYLDKPFDYAGTKVAVILMNSDTMTQRNHNSCTAAAQQRHSSCTAAAQQLHSSCTAAAQQLHSSCTAAAQQLHSS